MCRHIPNCSHWIQQDQPELTNKYMWEFLLQPKWLVCFRLIIANSYDSLNDACIALLLVSSICHNTRRCHGNSAAVVCYRLKYLKTIQPIIWNRNQIWWSYRRFTHLGQFFHNIIWTICVLRIIYVSISVLNNQSCITKIAPNIWITLTERTWFTKIHSFYDSTRDT